MGRRDRRSSPGHDAEPLRVRATPVERRGSYRVGQAMVGVTATVGAAQLGDITLRLDGDRVASGQAPTGPLTLGAGPALSGKLLVVDAIVTDVSRKTDALRLTVALTGGAASRTFVVDDQVGAAGGTGRLRVTVLFKMEPA